MFGAAWGMDWRWEPAGRRPSHLVFDMAQHPESSTPLIAIGTAKRTASGARGLPCGMAVAFQCNAHALLCMLLGMQGGGGVRQAPWLAWCCMAQLHGVAWRGAARRGAARRGAAWRGAAWRGVARRGVARLTGRPASSPAQARRQDQLHPRAAAMPGHRSRRRVRLGE